MKTIIVISSLVDSTIREYQPDVTFMLFRTIEDLDKHIATTPIRAESLFFTRDTMPQVNTSLNYLGGLLENPFLKCDKVVYITEKDSRELSSVRYIIEARGYDNWEIVEGYLTREYVSGIINGTLRTDNVGAKRKAVYRVPKEAYVRDKLKNKESLSDKYVDDEQDLADIPDEQPPIWVPQDIETDGQVLHIAGDAIEERTVFAFLAAQYMALTDKTLILERDIEYHLLTEYVTKSGVDCCLVDVQDVLLDPNRAIEVIRKSPKQLVCVVCKPRIEYSYSFIFNVLYNNLKRSVRYFIREDVFSEVPNSAEFTVAMRSSVPGILAACEQIDPSFAHLANFVGVNFQSLPETKITSSTQVELILRDVLNITKAASVVLNVSSLKIGGDSGYDLRSVLRRD